MFQTREEVRETLDNELRAFSTDLEISAAENIAWNHREFQVRYICLAEEIKIGDYFLRVLLEESEEKLCFQRPYDFFNDLYHRFLTSQRSDMRCICLQVSYVEKIQNRSRGTKSTRKRKFISIASMIYGCRKSCFKCDHRAWS